MTNAILTPLDFSAPVKAGRRRFWKQILPVTEINYKGEKVKFDPEFHKDLQLAHQEGVYDQVPIVFADSENRHNMDPRNFGGEVLDLQYRGEKQGTWALIEADRDAARAIKKNPKLGVSARILQGIQKADGRTFKRAVNHVLLTMNPRVSGMEPWQAVDLSDEDADIEVVDLTAETYEEGNPMGKPATKQKSKATSEIDLSRLSDEQFQQMLDLAAAATAEADEDVEDEDLVDEEEVEEDEPKRKTRRKKSKTKVTIEKDSEDDGDPEDDEDEEEEDDDDDVETDLSESEVVRRNEDLSTVRSMQIDLAEQRWAGERTEYLREGVPPFLLDLAEPVLSQPEAVVLDLSDDESIDATDTIRKMLDGVKGMIDLTPEIGHQIDLSEKDKDDSDDAFLKAWDEQYG